MNKEQALNQFWNSFGWDAYDENTVPDDAELPYITYNFITSKINEPKVPSVSLWHRSSSWETISLKAHEIFDNINGKTIKYDDGAIIIWGGTYQRMGDPDPMIRRIVPDLQYEFLER